MRKTIIGKLRARFERKPDFIIGAPGEPQLRRWWLIPRNKWLGVYLHQVLKDDEDRAHHDHSYMNVSILIAGGLAETYKKDKTRQFRRFVPIIRLPSTPHRLWLPKGSQYAWTIFIMGPRVREWGFHCPKGWVHWKQFVAENIGEVGRGCGEDDL